MEPSLTAAMNSFTKSTLAQGFCNDIAKGLGSMPKRTSPKYLYDRRGSELFEQICTQPEYYLTRTEAAILRQRASDIVNLVVGDKFGRGDRKRNTTIAIVELGSGSSSKTRILLRSFVAGMMQKTKKRYSLHYFPIDISPSILDSSTATLSTEFPELNVTGLAAEYVDGLAKARELISDISPARCLVTFLGSSIGNFEPDEAESFTAAISEEMNEGDLMLIGFDLQKDERILYAAYNDAAGITAEFNLNILHRINGELGGEFDPSLFKHYASYNRSEHRMEMHLVSQKRQEVYIRQAGKKIDFEEGETIHTENSYKYSRPQIESMASNCGLQVKKHFMDRRRWFDLVLFERV